MTKNLYSLVDVDTESKSHLIVALIRSRTLLLSRSGKIWRHSPVINLSSVFSVVYSKHAGTFKRFLGVIGGNN